MRHGGQSQLVVGPMASMDLPPTHVLFAGKRKFELLAKPTHGVQMRARMCFAALRKYRVDIEDAKKAIRVAFPTVLLDSVTNVAAGFWASNATGYSIRVSNSGDDGDASDADLDERPLFVDDSTDEDSDSSAAPRPQKRFAAGAQSDSSGSEARDPDDDDDDDGGSGRDIGSGGDLSNSDHDECDSKEGKMIEPQFGQDDKTFDETSATIWALSANTSRYMKMRKIIHKLTNVRLKKVADIDTINKYGRHFTSTKFGRNVHIGTAVLTSL
jgi:hypothetical protein